MTDDPLMKASEAPLMDHLVELRTRLLKSLFALAITFAFCFYFADFIFAYLLSPYEAAALAVSPNADLQLIYTAPHEFLFSLEDCPVLGVRSFHEISMDFHELSMN